MAGSRTRPKKPGAVCPIHPESKLRCLACIAATPSPAKAAAARENGKKGGRPKGSSGRRTPQGGSAALHFDTRAARAAIRKATTDVKEAST